MNCYQYLQALINEKESIEKELSSYKFFIEGYEDKLLKRLEELEEEIAEVEEEIGF